MFISAKCWWLWLTANETENITQDQPKKYYDCRYVTTILLAFTIMVNTDVFAEKAGQSVTSKYNTMESWVKGKSVTNKIIITSDSGTYDCVEKGQMMLENKNFTLDLKHMDYVPLHYSSRFQDHYFQMKCRLCFHMKRELQATEQQSSFSPKLRWDWAWPIMRQSRKYLCVAAALWLQPQ